MIYVERRKRDLNPRAGHPTYTLSRGASSASWVFLQILKYNLYLTGQYLIVLQQRIGYYTKETSPCQRK